MNGKAAKTMRRNNREAERQENKDLRALAKRQAEMLQSAARRIETLTDKHAKLERRHDRLRQAAEAVAAFRNLSYGGNAVEKAVDALREALKS